MSKPKSQTRPYFFPYQWKWIDNPNRKALGEKSRRVGLTYAESYRCTRDSLSGNVIKGKTWFSSADLSASEEFIDYIRFWSEYFGAVAKFADQVVIDKENDISAHRAVFSNGCKIYAISSNPSQFRGKGGDIILDEYAHHHKQDKLFAAANPSSIQGNRVRIISTHNGESTYFNTLVKEILKGDQGTMKNWSHFKITIEDAIKEGLIETYLNLDHKPTEEEKAEFLYDLFSGMTQEAIDEEFYCVPTSDSNSHLLTYELINAIERDNILYAILEQCIGSLFMGVDIGRKSDPTVIMIGEELGEVIHTRHYLRLKNKTFTEQQNIIYRLLNHPKMRRAALDATGLGMQMAEQAQEKFGTFKVEPVTFNRQIKEELAEHTYITVEKCKVLIPRDKILRDALYKIRAIKTPAGNTRYEADRDEKGHADEFWSLALMLHAAKNYSGTPTIHSAGKLQTFSTMKNYFNTRNF
jgi:phage FluMu gp28-like protein